MAAVTTPFGTTFEETQPVALAYYRREEGYQVDGVDDTEKPAAVSTTKSPPATPPAQPSAPPAQNG